MRVRVRLFAGLRSARGVGRTRARGGVGRRRLVATRARRGTRRPALRGQPGVRGQVNGRLPRATRSRSSRPSPAARSDWRTAPLDLAAVVAEVEDDRAGAIATFQGTVRRQSRSRAGDRARVRGLRRHGREGHGRDRRGREGAPRPLRGRDRASDRPLRGRRRLGRDRGLGRAPASAR